MAGQNLGYAKGNNLGLSKVQSEYALILNPDAILHKDTLKNFLIGSVNFPDFAIIGPAKQDEYSIIEKYQDKEQVFEVNSLKGFALFLNLKQFDKIGFLMKIFYLP